MKKELCNIFKGRNSRYDGHKEQSDSLGLKSIQPLTTSVTFAKSLTTMDSYRNVGLHSTTRERCLEFCLVRGRSSRGINYHDDHYSIIDLVDCTQEESISLLDFNLIKIVKCNIKRIQT